MSRPVFLFIYTMTQLVQWNIRGVRGNYEELVLLCNQHNPSVIALQETLIQDDKPFTFSNFSSLRRHTSRGVALLIKKNILFSEIHLNTTLEAVAARISLLKPVTVCSIYLSPSIPITIQQLSDLMDQLPKPVLILGDFNSHSPLWGDDVLDSRGKIIEDFINQLNLSVLNDGSPTYCYPATVSMSHIDLSITDPTLFLDFDWSVHTDLCGSDHFPIILKTQDKPTEDINGFWKLKNVNWERYSNTMLSALLAVK